MKSSGQFEAEINNEAVYLRACESVFDARAWIGRYLAFQWRGARIGPRPATPGEAYLGRAAPSPRRHDRPGDFDAAWSWLRPPTPHQNRKAPRSAKPGRNPLNFRGALSGNRSQLRPTPFPARNFNEILAQPKDV